MDVSDSQLRVVLRHANPIEQYARRIAEAHTLGYGPGEHVDIWGVEFQCMALEVWKETLPPLFLRQVASSYKHCAWLMESALPDDWVAEDWEATLRHLSTVAAAVDTDPDCIGREVPLDASDIGHIPEVIRYDRLAELMHPSAVDRLRSAAAAVVRFCRFNSSIAPNETELACLQGLANGEKRSDMAKRLGYSERQLRRILANLWAKLGVANDMQGLAISVVHGWVTLPSNKATR
ncbi:MAG: hypothetical protein OXG30_15970 [bacterium]|nr:hypothetical protein [bacterium]